MTLTNLLYLFLKHVINDKLSVKCILTYCKAIFRTRIIIRILSSEIKYILYIRSCYGDEDISLSVTDTYKADILVWWHKYHSVTLCFYDIYSHLVTDVTEPTKLVMSHFSGVRGWRNLRSGRILPLTDDTKGILPRTFCTMALGLLIIGVLLTNPGSLGEWLLNQCCVCVFLLCITVILLICSNVL